jgi:hypothetical protein
LHAQGLLASIDSSRQTLLVRRTSTGPQRAPARAVEHLCRFSLKRRMGVFR